MYASILSTNHRTFLIVVAVGFLLIVGFLIGRSSPYNLVSLGGAIVLITFGFIFSANPGMVSSYISISMFIFRTFHKLCNYT